jgi:hypothetical protein
MNPTLDRDGDTGETGAFTGFAANGAASDATSSRIVRFDWAL